MSGTRTDFQDDPTAEALAWQPGPDVLHHSGLPLPPGRDFFAAAPPEIGEVITAGSTLRADRRPMTLASRLLLCGMLSSIGWTAAHFALPAHRPAPEWIAGGAIAVLALVLTRFRHTCDYVGRSGVARFTCSGRRDRLVRAEVFLFESARDLRTRSVQNYQHGVYVGTAYGYNWTDSEGRRRFRLAGSYWGEKRPPKPSSPFHLAESAESAWSQHRLARAIGELDRDGLIRFQLGGGDSVGVGPGFLELNIKGQQARCEADEIAGLSIRGGVFEIRRNDAKVGWFSKSGVFTFEYSKMANAELFLITISKLLGVRFQ